MKSNRVSMAFFALLLASLACTVGGSTANIRDAWTARDEAGEQRTTAFEQNETFYVKVELANAPDDTTVRAAFTAVDVEGEEDNKFIDDDEVTSGSGEVTFTMSNSRLWPAGKYKAEIFLNGELARTLDFEVKGTETAQATEPPASTPSPEPTQTAEPTQAVPLTATSQLTQGGAVTITRAFLALDEDGNQPTTRFSPTDTVYTLITVNAPQGARMKAVWVAIDAENLAPKSVVDEFSFDVDGSGEYWVSYFPPGGNDWQPGSYTVEIYTNDKLATSLGYSIAAGEFVPADQGVTGAYMAFDEDGSAPTAVFAQQDTFYFVVSFNAPGGVTLRAEWYALDTQDFAPDAFLDEFEIDVFDVGTTWFSMTPNGIWSIGTYQVDLYLDNQYVLSLNFEVQ